MSRRLPKLKGFQNPHRTAYAVVNLSALAIFDPESVIDPRTLRDRGLAKRRGKIKILGNGALAAALTVRAHAFSASARRKITEAGGKWEVIA